MPAERLGAVGAREVPFRLQLRAADADLPVDGAVGERRKDVHEREDLCAEPDAEAG